MLAAELWLQLGLERCHQFPAEDAVTSNEGMWLSRVVDFCRASQEGRKQLQKNEWLWEPDSDFLMENS